MTGKKQSERFNARGILRCARYGFMPNRLHFCGPDKNTDLFGYCCRYYLDRGLNVILKEFATLYPYLKFIARSNAIRDPFDERVIDAYWLGNALLENISRGRLYDHLLDDHQFKKKFGYRDLDEIKGKISLGAKPHHSFHVINVWKRTGHLEEAHTLNSMDLCRISWGKVVKVEKPHFEVEYQPLALEGNKLKLGQPVAHKIMFEIANDGFVKDAQPGQWVSFHWDFACELISDWQAANLKKYTLESIALANS